MQTALATCAAMPDGNPDEDGLAAALGAERPVWSDPAVEWDRYDRVVIRSTWDYTLHPGAFLAWCAAVGAQRLRNPPDLVAWNHDKRYLGTLNVPTVPTRFVEPADPLPALDGQLVVKPNVSAGARHTGRFGPDEHDAARALIAAIQASGRTALVQPYQPSVDARGETALVFLGGELSHVLHKRAVLAGGIAPTTDDALQVARVMRDPDLVTPGRAGLPEIRLAERVIGELTKTFGALLYARVDLIHDTGGAPMIIELELIEPALYLAQAPGAEARFATAIAGRDR